ncbi:MAG: DUF2635 domain-containing protein [Janthinobacterium svalbardensis]
MMTQHLVVPRAGILVPLPDGNGNLPPNGRPVVLSSYWYQRERDGDLTIHPLPEPADEGGTTALEKKNASTKPRAK